eukprot:10491686-Prorocentrum_lima.AAC.1
MTSSLVGSEMCIRDRTMTPCAISPQRPTLKRWPSTASSRQRITSRTVSYTHLTLPTICSV